VRSHVRPVCGSVFAAASSRKLLPQWVKSTRGGSALTAPAAPQKPDDLLRCGEPSLVRALAARSELGMEPAWNGTLGLCVIVLLDRKRLRIHAHLSDETFSIPAIGMGCADWDCRRIVTIESDDGRPTCGSYCRSGHGCRRSLTQPTRGAGGRCDEAARRERPHIAALRDPLAQGYIVAKPKQVLRSSDIHRAVVRAATPPVRTRLQGQPTPPRLRR
jgi:hypothetical protein